MTDLCYSKLFLCPTVKISIVCGHWLYFVALKLGKGFTSASAEVFIICHKIKFLRWYGSTYWYFVREFRLLVGATFWVSFGWIIAWSDCESSYCSSRVLCLELCAHWFSFLFLGFKLREIDILRSLIAILMTTKRRIIWLKLTVV